MGEEILLKKTEERLSYQLGTPGMGEASKSPGTGAGGGLFFGGVAG